MNILITGGTGTLGKALVQHLEPHCDRLIVFSRDEYKQYEMKKQFPEGGERGLRYFVGDIKDEERLYWAFKDVDVVIHTAAMKHIDVAEYNPSEVIHNNVLGTLNVARMCAKRKVDKAIFISTDKAPASSTLYGATKLCGERLWISCNNLGSTKFSCVRYGNVIGSRGSVFSKWEELAAKGEPLPITHPEMTRFFWTINEAARFVFLVAEVMKGGELFLPKMKSYKIIDLAKKISDNIKIIGLRGYEKLHETLLCEEEIRNCWEAKDYFIVYPFFHDWAKELYLHHDAIQVPSNFTYTSEIK